MTGDVRDASRRGLCKPPQCIMVLKPHRARLVMNEQKPRLVEPSLWYFAFSQFWSPEQTAPESALWPLSRRRIKILWATDSSGGFKPRTV